MKHNRKITETTEKEFIEFIRLALISNIFSVDEAHQKLYALIEQEEVPDIALINAVMSSDKESISQHLKQVKRTYNPMIVECLMASELLDRHDRGRVSPQKVAFALYLQLIDEGAICWRKDQNMLMKFDDGFRLIDYGLGNEQILAMELILFLKNKVKDCGSGLMLPA